MQLATSIRTGPCLYSNNGQMGSLTIVFRSLVIVSAIGNSPLRLADKSIVRNLVKDFPDIRAHESADALATDDDVDLVIISTPPNTHADLSIKMMASGKHVLCEKPLAFNRKETDA